MQVNQHSKSLAFHDCCTQTWLHAVAIYGQFWTMHIIIMKGIVNTYQWQHLSLSTAITALFLACEAFRLHVNGIVTNAIPKLLQCCWGDCDFMHKAAMICTIMSDYVGGSNLLQSLLCWRVGQRIRVQPILQIHAAPSGNREGTSHSSALFAALSWTVWNPHHSSLRQSTGLVEPPPSWHESIWCYGQDQRESMQQVAGECRRTGILA